MKKTKRLFFAWFIFFNLICSSLYATEVLSPINANPIQKTISSVYEKYKSLQVGKNADYIPELAVVNPHYFGIAVATIDGKIYSVGDANVPFAIESIVKLFDYALALQDRGEKFIFEKVGLDATGYPFNSVMAIEKNVTHLQNPFVNAGAIQVASLINGKTSDEKWQRTLHLMEQLSNTPLQVGEKVYQSEMATNQHNRAIAELLNSYEMMYGDPDDAVMRYTKACSIMVTARSLATMGITLANGGVNPITHRAVIEKSFVRDILSEMVVNGLYEKSGAWFVKVGIPTKSGVGGGILAIVPGKMAIAVFSPPLDEAGNSVRGQAVVQELSNRWDLHLL